MLLSRLPERRTAADSVAVSTVGLVREGLAFVRRQPVIAACLRAATLLNLTCGAHIALSALYLVRELHVPPGVTAVLLATGGLGSILGAACTPRLVRSLGSARACRTAALCCCLGALVLPLGSGTTGAALFSFGNLLFEGGLIIFSATTRTYRQLASPAVLLSRVMASVRFISWTALPIGGLTAGVLAQSHDARLALLLLATGALMAPLMLYGLRQHRDFPLP